MSAFIAAALSWLLRGVVLKFIVMTVIFAAVEFLVPMVIGFIAPFVSGNSLTSAFGMLPAGVWYFLDFFNLSYGVPLILSAYVSRFLIRRLPVVG